MDAFYQYTSHEGIRNALAAFQTVTFGAGGLAEGTDSATIKTGSAIDYAIAGVHQSQKSSTDNIDMTPSDADPELDDNKSAILAVFLDTSGDFSVDLGEAKDTGSEDDLCLPDFDPESVCCVGAAKLVNASGDAVTLGTDDITDTSGLTATFYDFYHAVPFQVIDEA